MKNFTLKASDGVRHNFLCFDEIDGIAIDPVLPDDFFSTANEARDERSRAWWGVPFVKTYHCDVPLFIETWGGPRRFDVYVLDGGAWDRPTCHGMFGDLVTAVRWAARLSEKEAV